MKTIGNRWIRKLSLGLGLFVLWLLLSWHSEPLLLGLGLLSSAAVVLLALRMQVLDREGHPVHLGARTAAYWWWLAGSVLRANLTVLRLICQSCLRPRAEIISPVLGSVQSSQTTDLGQATYANSITLTPGTVALGMRGGRIEVHALTRQQLRKLEQGELDRRVTRLEGNGPC